MQSLTDCRICHGDTFESIVDLGQMAQGGLFPPIGTDAPTLPLHLVQCLACGLVQLGDRLDVSQLYGDHYGYRSGLNASMAQHLTDIVTTEVPKWINATRGAYAALDIGSNDGTLLSAYPSLVRRVGIDPSMKALSRYYAPGIEQVSGFFSAERLTRYAPFRVITSIAMFYDLDDPVAFAKDVRTLLTHDGVWILEQGYWPELARQGAYDVICHEHIEYYSLQDMLHIMDRAGLVIKSVSFNGVNGGSFRLVVGKGGPKCTTDTILTREADVQLDTFRQHVAGHGAKLKAFLTDLKTRGATIHGYGASTKGSTVLQHAGIGPELIDCIVDVSEAKAGCWTPGTHIPIVNDAPYPDYYLVGPWHYRDSILKREQKFLDGGGSFIFPLPDIEVVHAEVLGVSLEQKET